MDANQAVASPRDGADEAPGAPDGGPALDAGGPGSDEVQQPGDGGDAVVADRDADDGNRLDLEHLEGVIESLLLASGAPVPLRRLVEALCGPGKADVSRALASLAERYEREGRGMRVVQVAGGYQMRSAPQHGPFVRRLLGGRPPRLSRPMLETLAIVAYRQPCTRPEIEAIRGVDCGAAVNSLVERRLVRIEGRKEAPGRPLLYGTTREFLEVFGLPDLQALPPLRELGEGARLLAATDLTVAADGVHATPAATLAPPAGSDAAADAVVDAASATPPAADLAEERVADDADAEEPFAVEQAGSPIDGDGPGFVEPVAGDPPLDGVGVAAAAAVVG